MSKKEDESRVKDFLNRLATDKDLTFQTKELWLSKGPPTWFVQSFDDTTGEHTEGHYLLSYLTEEQIRNYFLELYRSNPAYAAHKLRVELFPQGIQSLQEAKNRGLLKGSKLEEKV